MDRARQEPEPKRLKPEPWMDAWDETLAESFPASDPPAGPGSIGGPDLDSKPDARDRS